MEIELRSTAFEPGGMIPRKYAYDNQNLSPPLKWSQSPEATRSFALVCDDPDAPMGSWVHWVIFNIPLDAKELPEGVPPEKVLKSGAKQGKNDFGKIGYGGPAPPSGTHRYVFKIYALDTVLNLEPGITKKQLLEAVRGHILAEGELVGKYKTR